MSQIDEYYKCDKNVDQLPGDAELPIFSLRQECKGNVNHCPKGIPSPCVICTKAQWQVAKFWFKRDIYKNLRREIKTGAITTLFLQETEAFEKLNQLKEGTPGLLAVDWIYE